MPMVPLAEVEAAVAALHPGPSPDFAFAQPAPRTAAERLASAEADLIKAAVRRHVRGDGHLGDLARLVIVLRADVASTKGN